MMLSEKARHERHGFCFKKRLPHLKDSKDCHEEQDHLLGSHVAGVPPRPGVEDDLCGDDVGPDVVDHCQSAHKPEVIEPTLLQTGSKEVSKLPGKVTGTQLYAL